MFTKNRKTIATILIVLVTVVLFIGFMYLEATNERPFSQFTGILFAIFPALAINAIWNPRINKKNK